MTLWPIRPWSSTTRASRRRPSRKTPSSFRPTAPSSGRPRSLSAWKIPHPLPLSGVSAQRVGERGDSDSITLKAIRLYQELLRFHQNDEDKSALLDADIERLSFGNNKAVGEEKAALYKMALQRFVKQWGDHPISAIARFRLASVLQQEGSLVEAHDLAQQGARAFPNTPGGNLCYNLVKQIEAKSASIITERVWNEPSPSIRVTYRNLTKVYFRLVREDWLGRLQERPVPRANGWTTPQRKAILAAQARSGLVGRPAGDRGLPAAGRGPPAPKDLKPGFYYLLASHDAGFSASNNVVSYTDVWVSKLALVVRQQQQRRRSSAVSCSMRPPASRSKGPKCRSTPGIGTATSRTGAKAKTDRNGLFSVSGVAEPAITCSTSRTRARSWPRPTTCILIVNNYRPIPQKQVVFFTDRSLYRPGQTIYYKGIAILVDQEGDNYKVLPNERVNVVFSDVNGKEIARQTAGHERLRFLQRQLHGPPRSADGPDDDPHRRHPGQHLGERGRIQAAQVPGHARRAEDGRPAGRRGPARGQGHCVYRGGGGRGQDPLSRRPPGPLSRLVVLVLRLADAATRARRKSPTARPKPGPTARFKIQFIAKPDLSVAGERRAGLPATRSRPT